MDCKTFRYWSVVELSPDDTDWLAHRRKCVPCAAFAREIDQLNAKIDRALHIPVPSKTVSAAEFHEHRSERRRGWSWFSPQFALPAIVASFLLILVGSLLRSPSHPSLDELLDQHLSAHTLDTETPDLAAETVLTETIFALGGRVSGSFPTLVQADLCEIGGLRSAHLVFAGARGPVSVIVVPSYQRMEQFEWARADQSGLIVPFGQGLIAIVGPTEEADWQTELDRLQAGIEL